MFALLYQNISKHLLTRGKHCARNVTCESIITYSSLLFSEPGMVGSDLAGFCQVKIKSSSPDLWAAYGGRFIELTVPCTKETSYFS